MINFIILFVFLIVYVFCNVKLIEKNNFLELLRYGCYFLIGIFSIKACDFLAAELNKAIFNNWLVYLGLAISIITIGEMLSGIVILIILRKRNNNFKK